MFIPLYYLVHEEIQHQGCSFSVPTYILSPAEDSLVSAIIFLTFISSRPNFTVTFSYSGPAVVFTI